MTTYSDAIDIEVEVKTKFFAAHPEVTAPTTEETDRCIAGCMPDLVRVSNSNAADRYYRCYNTGTDEHAVGPFATEDEARQTDDTEGENQGEYEVIELRSMADEYREAVGLTLFAVEKKYMSSGLEARMIPTKVDGINVGSKVVADCWYVVHSASGRSMLPRYGATQAEAELMIASIYTAIPEADWTKPVAELAKIPNLQTRILKA